MTRARRISMAGLFALLLCPLGAPALSGQQDSSSFRKRFTNQDVIEMVKLGLSEDVVIAKIRAATSADTESVRFDTSIDALKALKAAEVPDSVIKVMINPAPPPAPIIAGNSPISTDPTLPPPEIGVYWKDASKFVLLQGQNVTNTKAGGKAGAFFTYGLRNQHWDAMIEGPISKNVVRDRHPIFYLYVPEGDDSSDFILLHMNKKGNRREFQIGSFGGVTGGKSGVQRDKEVPFHAEHAGIRVYKLTLDEDLKPGEFCFFMGTGQANTMAGARGRTQSGGAAAGRVYDFSVPE